MGTEHTPRAQSVMGVFGYPASVRTCFRWMEEDRGIEPAVSSGWEITQLLRKKRAKLSKTQ